MQGITSLPDADGKPYDGANLERLSFSDLTALILSASGPALDAIELFVTELQTANELAPDSLAPEGVRLALSRIVNLRGTIAYRRTELAVATIEEEARRMIDVATVHRATLLRELGDTDPRAQRGNACAFGYADGMIAGLIEALRLLGRTDAADRIGNAWDQVQGVAGERP